MSSVVNYSGMERDLTQHGASRVLWTALHNSRICDDGSIQLDTRCASPSSCVASWKSMVSILYTAFRNALEMF